MLQEMRKFTKSWIANIFLGLLTLSFVSWGANSWFDWGTDTSVVKIGGVAIDQADFRRDYQNALKSQGDQRGSPLSGEEARRMNLHGQLLEQEISQRVLDNVSRELGLRATDGMVTAQIQSIPAFIGLTGQFDRQTFIQRITSIGYSEQGFINLVRADTTRSQLVRALEGSFQMPAGYARALFSFATEERAAEYIVVDARSIGPIAPPSDTVLQAYVKAHASRFSTPEYRDVGYAWVSPEDVSAGITVTEKQIKDAYDANLERYVIPEKRDLQQIEFKTEADAAAARARITAGSTFEQVASARGERPVPLGELVAEDLDASQSKPVFSLKEGEVSPPLKTASGAAVLIKVVKIVPGSTKGFDQAKEEIRTAMVQELAQSKLTDIANAYTDASSEGLSLADAAKKVGMHTARIPAMDSRGYAPDGTKTSAPDDPEFRQLVFRAEPGEEGDPQPLKTGTYVIGVNGAIPPKLKPLDQVREQALAAWTAEQRAILLKKKAQELAGMVNRNREIDSAAKSVGTTVQQSPALRHGWSDDTFSSELVAELYRATPGQAVAGPKGKSGDWVVARLTGIVHPPLPENSVMYQGAVRQISQQAAAGITESFVAEQRIEQGVKYNQKMIQSIVGAEADEQ